MSTNKKIQLERYRKSLLNRVSTTTLTIPQYLEGCLSREDEAINHTFHKVMVHNWSGTANQLFDTLSDYFKSTIIPILYESKADITSFYTSSLSLILKIIKLDFMFPFQRNMFNIDVLFNDKNSLECFDNQVSIEDIVSGVVSRRMNEHFELDLSNFCCDPEFVEKKICFYKITLLAHFKILMLRMGRDAKSLNLSNNELSQVPMDILNFFIKGNLTDINLSNNNLPSLAEVLRVSSRIEKLWIEGNPLCDELDPIEYVKNVTMKFPRLTELDGITLNQNGLTLPYIQNYLVVPDRRTKMVTEKFLTLYFSNFDNRKKKTFNFYDDNAILTVVSNFTEEQKKRMPQIANLSRNILDAIKTNPKKPLNYRVYSKRSSIAGALSFMPRTVHDPTTFTVDVLHHDRRSMILVVDGVFKIVNDATHVPDEMFQFRRTFVFNITTVKQNSTYLIHNEIFSLSSASEEQVKGSFLHPIINLNDLELIDPEPEDKEAIIKAFIHTTQLKRHEAETRLKFQKWDIRKALILFIGEMKYNKISKDKFIEDDDFSDTSSLIEDEID